MGAGYKGTMPAYIDDFIYQPPWKEMAAALDARNKDVQDVADKLELFGNLQFDYWKDADAANAQAVKEEYESAVKELYEQLQQNLMDPRVRQKVRWLQNRLREDMSENGRIGLMQRNLQQYKQWQEQLKKAPLSEQEREGYMNAIKWYLRDNPRGALDAIYEGPKIIPRQQLVEDFVKSDMFKKLPKKTQDKFLNNHRLLSRVLWVKATDEDLDAKLIRDVFKTFVEQNPQYREAASIRQKYLGEKWLDEDGNIIWDGTSYPGRSMNALEAYAIHNKKLQAGGAIPRYGSGGGSGAGGGGLTPVVDYDVSGLFVKSPAGANNIRAALSQFGSAVSQLRSAGVLSPDEYTQYIGLFKDATIALNTSNIDPASVRERTERVDASINNLITKIDERIRKAKNKAERAKLNAIKRSLLNIRASANLSMTTSLNRILDVVRQSGKNAHSFKTRLVKGLSEATKFNHTGEFHVRYTDSHGNVRMMNFGQLGQGRSGITANDLRTKKENKIKFLNLVYPNWKKAGVDPDDVIIDIKHKGTAYPLHGYANPSSIYAVVPSQIIVTLPVEEVGTSGGTKTVSRKFVIDADAILDINLSVR